MPRIQLRLTPRGHLLLEEANDAPTLEDTVAARLARAFDRGTGYGLLQLGAGEIGRSLPPAFIWWRDFAVRYLEAVCLHGSGGAGETPSAAVLSVGLIKRWKIGSLLVRPSGSTMVPRYCSEFVGL